MGERSLLPPGIRPLAGGPLRKEVHRPAPGRAARNGVSDASGLSQRTDPQTSRTGSGSPRNCRRRVGGLQSEACRLAGPGQPLLALMLPASPEPGPRSLRSSPGPGVHTIPRTSAEQEDTPRPKDPEPSRGRREDGRTVRLAALRCACGLKRGLDTRAGVPASTGSRTAASAATPVFGWTRRPESDPFDATLRN
jgi:hypothetical protein